MAISPRMQQNFGVNFYIIPNLLASPDQLGRRGFGSNGPGGMGNANSNFLQN